MTEKPEIQAAEAYQLPWYDSPWLSCYFQAKDIVKSVYPDQIEAFEQAFDILRTDHAFREAKVSGVISPSRLEELRQVILEYPQEQLETQELLTFGRYVIHDHPVFDQLQQELTDQLSQLAGEPLEPSYNFLALYNNLGYCQPHMDAPNAKWTLDICLQQSDIWPIQFSQIQPWPEDFARKARQDAEHKSWGYQWPKAIIDNPANHFTEHRMEEGEAIFFSGSSQWHYRPRIEQCFKQNFCHLLFLHYIPKGTRELVDPNNWARLFSMPELGKIRFNTSRVE